MDRRPHRSPSPPARARVAAGVAATLAAAGLAATATAERTPRPATELSARAGAPAAPAGGAPEAYFTLDGTAPASSPATRLGVGFLALDQRLTDAVAVLGEPTSVGPDISGTASTWKLPGGARLTVSAWADGGDGTDGISGLSAEVPEGSPVRFGLSGGVVLGRSTLRDVVAAWGDGYTPALAPGNDFVVRYVECVGEFPVVVKFDQAAATDERFAPEPSSALWDEPVTTVLVAYADEPPGSAGCGATTA